MTVPVPTDERTSPHPCGAIFATQEWQRAWERATIEPADELVRVGPDDLALRRVGDSPFWRGYELDAGGRRTWTDAVAYLSTVYAFSNPLNRASEPAVEQTVTAALAQARDWDVAALAVPNLEPGPVLQSLTSFGDEPHGPPAPDVLVRLDITSRLDLVAGFEPYLESLSHSRRSQFRRKHRRASEHSVTYHRLRGSDAERRVEEYVSLTDASAAKHGIPPLYDGATLRAMLAVPGAELLTAEHEGQLLAGLLSFRHEDSLVLWSGGIRYETAKEHYPYVFLLYEILREAGEEGVRWVDFGRGNMSFKSQYGFVPTELWTAIYLMRGAGSSELRARLEAMHRGIADFLELPV